jgi:hypothetical protein
LFCSDVRLVCGSVDQVNTYDFTILAS